MKLMTLCARLGGLCASLFALGLQAQTYSIDWHKIAGGGGTSIGGPYQVNGTVGQPDAGRMSGGIYSLEGGFWSIIAAVQTPGAPLLSLTLTAVNTSLISWPYPSTGFGLQHNTALGTTNWISVTNSPAQVGNQWQVTVRSSVGTTFYRLKQ